MFPNNARGNALLAIENVESPIEGLAMIVHKTKNLLCAVYDFAVLGGAVSSIPLVDDQGNPAILPVGAIVTNVVAYVVTAVTTAASGTLSLGLLTTTDLQGATAAGTLTLGAKVAGTPVGTAATWVGPVVTTTGTQLQASIATGALTAGKVKYFVEYVCA